MHASIGSRYAFAVPTRSIVAGGVGETQVKSRCGEVFQGICRELANYGRMVRCIDYNEVKAVPAFDNAGVRNESTDRTYVSILKPIPEAAQVKRNLCPICGKASYSRDGIHPQCSLDRADAVRFDKIREQRKADAKIEKPKMKRHLSKTCPECRANVHVRVNACSCGHEFVKRVAAE